MYARVVTAQALPGKLDETVRVWRDSIVPANNQEKGWVSARMLVDRKIDKAMVVAIWETEDDIRASGGDYLKGQLAKFVRLLATPPIEKMCDGLSRNGVLLFTFGGTIGPEEISGGFQGETFDYSTLGVNEFLRLIDEFGCTCKYLEYDQYPENHVYIIAQKVR